MDQARIGRFIAEKRKGKDMTQRQLAEKLGVTDKSVSKWERGVCLPEVSLYQALCGELGITLNEFFAGEELGPGDVERRSEETILGIARDDRAKTRRHRRRLLVMGMIIVLLGAAVVWAVTVLVSRDAFRTNYIRAYPESSEETTMKRLLTPFDAEVVLAKYAIDDSFDEFAVVVDRYRGGELVSSEEVMTAGAFEKESRAGIVALSVNRDTNQGTVTFACEDGGGSSVSGFKVNALKHGDDMTGSSLVGLSKDLHPVKKGKPVLLAAFYQAENELSALELEAGGCAIKELTAEHKGMCAAVIKVIFR